MSNPTGIRMPALFLAHGNPMNAIADNDFTRALERLAGGLPRPEAVMVVSAHWLTSGTHVLSVSAPRTIHDFFGFPRELYAVEYPAPGASHLAALVHRLLPGSILDQNWGLDHAAWAVLRHMWPQAEVPVFELSLDMGADPQTHWDLGRRLAQLRERGVLVVGSGNIVHSFAGASWEPNARPHPWALEFDAWVADALLRGDSDALVHYHAAGPAAQLAVPTNDHYLPLLYPEAMRLETDEVTFPYVGTEMASMSMRCVKFG
jgi:4,5-DOPA dioxygenase extradiol